MTSHLAAFLALSAVIIATPGPDTALTVRSALRGGRRAGIATAAGVATGQITWAFFTAAGIAAILRASQPAFLAIRIAGVAYLVFLGLQALRDALRSVPWGGGKEHGRPVRPHIAFRRGLFSNLSNPKMVVFFISLLPQFSTHGSFQTLFALGLTFALMTLLWLSGYALAVARAGNFLRRGRAHRLLEALTDLSLIALGLRLATERG